MVCGLFQDVFYPGFRQEVFTSGDFFPAFQFRDLFALFRIQSRLSASSNFIFFETFSFLFLAFRRRCFSKHIENYSEIVHVVS